MNIDPRTTGLRSLIVGAFVAGAFTLAGFAGESAQASTPESSLTGSQFGEAGSVCYPGARWYVQFQPGGGKPLDAIPVCLPDYFIGK